MVNYERVYGVGYRRFVGDEDEPVTEQRDAKVEEMYHDGKGQVILTVETDDGFLSLSVPVLARDSWNGFVESLPTWENE